MITCISATVNLIMKSSHILIYVDLFTWWLHFLLFSAVSIYNFIHKVSLLAVWTFPHEVISVLTFSLIRLTPASNNSLWCGTLEPATVGYSTLSCCQVICFPLFMDLQQANKAASSCCWVLIMFMLLYSVIYSFMPYNCHDIANSTCCKTVLSTAYFPKIN